MNKKAVIVGVGDYQDQQPTLTAPLNEVGEWADLLEQLYGFDDIRVLVDGRATKLAIMERLEWLFADAQNDDQLVFVFSGHGDRLVRRNQNGLVRDNMDEVIYAFPEGGANPEEYALYDDDLAALLLLSRLPPRVDITFVLDCCFGGGFSVSEPDQRKVFVRNVDSAPVREVDAAPRLPIDIARRRPAGKAKPFRFGESRRMLRAGQEPVVIAGAPELETLPVGTFEGRRRTVFGYHAINSLRQTPTQTYEEFRGSVGEAMVRERLDAPALSGNDVRFNHEFLN